MAAVIAAFGGAGYLLALAIGMLAGAVTALAGGLIALAKGVAGCAIAILLLAAIGSGGKK